MAEFVEAEYGVLGNGDCGRCEHFWRPYRDLTVGECTIGLQNTRNERPTAYTYSTCFVGDGENNMPAFQPR